MSICSLSKNQKSAIPPAKISGEDLTQAKIKLLRVFKKSSAATSLLQEVRKNVQVRLSTPSKEEIIAQNHGIFAEGYISFEKDALTISVCHEISFTRQLRAFLFELCNAQHRSAHEKITQALFTGRMASAEIYAQGIEYLEFLACSRYDKIIKDSIQDKSWSPSIEKYLYEYSDWNSYLKDQIANGHYQRYVDQYERCYKSKKEQIEFKKQKI